MATVMHFKDPSFCPHLGLVQEQARSEWLSLASELSQPVCPTVGDQALRKNKEASTKGRAGGVQGP